MDRSGFLSLIFGFLSSYSLEIFKVWLYTIYYFILYSYFYNFTFFIPIFLDFFLTFSIFFFKGLINGFEVIISFNLCYSMWVLNFFSLFFYIQLSVLFYLQ
jgi:hypothetical protein